jgi:hypothetical protein
MDAKEVIRKIEISIAVMSIAIPLITLAFSAWKYIDIRDSELRQQRFENYHSLVSKLTTTESSFGQLVTIYEFRNYPEYRDVTLRLLESLKEDLKKPATKKEIAFTIEALKNQ